MARAPRSLPPDIETYVHPADKRRNIPTAENQGLAPDDEKAVKTLRWPRNPDLDPRGRPSVSTHAFYRRVHATPALTIFH
ncbi:MAG TPA: hypothetical protein VII73_00090 [Caulobacteraceae bacterium]